MAEFSGSENALINAYIEYFKAVEQYLLAEEHYDDASDKCRRIARELPALSIADVGRLMHAAAERGEFPSDHIVTRNLDNAIDLATEAMRRSGRHDGALLSIDGPVF